jgi:hypothetical protein
MVAAIDAYGETCFDFGELSGWLRNGFWRAPVPGQQGAKRLSSRLTRIRWILGVVGASRF